MDFKQYPSYKDSGVEWLGGVPEHWSITPLKFAIKNWRNGKWGNDVVEASDDNLVCVRVADFDRQKGVINTEKLTLRNYKGERVSDCLLNENHILIERSGGGENQLVGATVKFSLNIKAVCSNFISLLEIKTNYFDLDFIQYYFDHLYSLNVNKLSIKQTSGIQNLDLKQYVKNHISFPEIFEQTQIVSFLDSETSRIDNLIAKQEKLIEKLEEHRKSVISHAVTKGLDPNVPMKDSGVEWLGEVPEHWKVSSLKRICEVKDGTHDTPSYIEFSESAFPLVTSKNLKKTGLTLNHCKYISKLDYENIIKRSNVKKNDILMPMIGTVGGAVIVNTDEPFAIKNVALFKNNNKICNKWLCYVLNSSLIDIQFLLFKNGGVQDFIGLNDLRNLIVPNIPLSQQKLITNYLDKQVYKIDHSIDKQRELIEKLKEYRTSIISHAVTGKIDVRDLVA